MTRKAFDPGAMREQVAIQTYTSAPDGAGGYTETWADVAGWDALWAEVAPLRGSEQLRGMQLTASATHRVRMWYLDGVKSTTHRLRRLRDDTVLEIIAAPAFDAERATMELLVHETEVPA